MAIIALEGMRFFAYHGYYEEEQILGNDFILDVYVNADTLLAAAVDELYVDPAVFKGEEPQEGKEKPTTVNYETIYLICQAEMRKTASLLEGIVERIAERIMEHFDNAEGVIVRLKKLHPPLGGRVDMAWVMSARGDIEIPTFSD
ncbi:MAG: dihydroneopterin aldolase [Phaeodactylibacter sp.]|nr:dihydroneopterin aldolase [Phaeodactylibacter sp.]MCB9292721.1 dihydroneopterin aldolase [Lewinellaceae bacterium]